MFQIGDLVRVVGLQSTDGAPPNSPLSDRRNGALGRVCWRELDWFQVEQEQNKVAAYHAAELARSQQSLPKGA